MNSFSIIIIKRERERESLQKAKKMKTYKDLEKIDMNKLAKP